ncbi:DUF707 domain-containing protein [Altererythrobacter sp. BO-6]|uniref:DUF707 domain-containing protein n=1 Tax=Altererythrobacter sp. BO-6 TaxID=2604537 RepID=UPI0013E12FAA|nr:DUF707 domain-containing protein [Altererythrobacter sp. BO-6]QIG53198.1 DUF707 domain-containing protein [Altererythrobacter sp. BO-6]
MIAPRQNLVFVRVGSKSLHRRWLAGKGERNWDLQLSQYDDDPEIGQGGDLPLSVDKGTKWDSVYRYLINNPEVLDRYRYIAFMDDDLLFTKEDLNRYFDICAENDLFIAQPALHSDSFFCYSILLHCPLTRLRYTNFVECMAAAIRTDYLRAFMPHMSNVISGWGMDRIWTVTMPSPAFKSAIIDEISMVHTRPHATGAVYDAFSDRELSPAQEMKGLISRYSGVPDKMLVYGAIGRDGRRLSGATTRALNGLSLLANCWRYRKPVLALKSGAAMLWRAIFLARYRPEPARQVRKEGA